MPILSSYFVNLFWFFVLFISLLRFFYWPGHVQVLCQRINVQNVSKKHFNHLISCHVYSIVTLFLKIAFVWWIRKKLKRNLNSQLAGCDVTISAIHIKTLFIDHKNIIWIITVYKVWLYFTNYLCLTFFLNNNNNLRI